MLKIKFYGVIKQKNKERKRNKQRKKEIRNKE